ncbi:MAG TPA: SDR family oxidoreductase [Anaerolineales bacterium]|nr:SDR family oxidoreductase [Anaerolineales bacterium]
MNLPNFDIRDQVAVVTGGTGVLCEAMCRALAGAGAKVVVLGHRPGPAEALAAELGNGAIGLACDVLARESLEAAAQKVLEAFGRVDILVNGAGGNKPGATTGPEQSFFDLPPEALHEVFDLNLIGTVFPCQVFGRIMAGRGSGVILNVSSMNAYRPLTRIPAYSAAKAGVSNFTGWLAVHMAREYSPAIRVNAIAPGFFLTGQNVYLLTDLQTGGPTARGQAILSHTPQGRFGVPDDLLGAMLWLVSPASAFVTGIVVPVDGGFSAYSGV